MSTSIQLSWECLCAELRWRPWGNININFVIAEEHDASWRHVLEEAKRPPVVYAVCGRLFGYLYPHINISAKLYDVCVGLPSFIIWCGNNYLLMKIAIKWNPCQHTSFIRAPCTKMAKPFSVFCLCLGFAGHNRLWGWETTPPAHCYTAVSSVCGSAYCYFD